MEKLNKWQSIVMLAGACLMVVGAGLLVFGVFVHAPWIFLAGALAFACMQAQQAYHGTNLTIKRLRRIMLMGDVLFVCSALLMVESTYNFTLPLFMKYAKNGYLLYLNYIHNNWVVLLLVAAVLEIYSTHRIASELEKEAKKN